jgi:hypothetical protein
MCVERIGSIGIVPDDLRMRSEVIVLIVRYLPEDCGILASFRVQGMSSDVETSNIKRQKHETMQEETKTPIKLRGNVLLLQ